MSAWIQRGTIAAGLALAWFWVTAAVAALCSARPAESWAPTFWTGFWALAPWTGGIVGSIGLVAMLSMLHDAAPAIAAQVTKRKLAQQEQHEHQQAETDRLLKAEGIDL